MLHSQSLPYTADISLLFKPFSQQNNAILLDSGKPRQAQGRYDIFTAYPSQQVFIDSQGIHHIDSDNCGHSVQNLIQLKNILNATQSKTNSTLPFTGGWMGFANYDLAAYIEPQSQTKTNSQQACFWAGYYQWAVVQDHAQQSCQLVWRDELPPALLDQIQTMLNSQIAHTAFTLNQAFTASISQGDYQQAFTQIQQYIHAGDCYQVNFALPFKATFQGDSFTAYQQLRKAVPSPFMAYLRFPQQSILSISPERFIAADGKQIETKPIKGTVARHSDKQIDRELANTLLNSAKNRAENIMIVDLMRNDFGRYCESGSVRVDALCALESFENVHHLVSTVRGTIASQYTIWDVFFASFPGGSITGAPKIRACQIIAELEKENRGIYCGSVFIASDNGHFDSNICIRTLSCQQQTITAWAGGGITADSTAEDEYQECLSKINALLAAL